jgi:hypothetical protein
MVLSLNLSVCACSILFAAVGIVPIAASKGFVMTTIFELDVGCGDACRVDSGTEPKLAPLRRQTYTA